MTAWHYLLLVNIYLLLFYTFYALLLRSETFFQLNRLYLVAASLLSFFIPVIQANWVKSLFITKQVQLTIYSSPLVVYRFKPMQHTQISIGQLLGIIYLAGMLFLCCRFIWQMIVLRKIIAQPDPSAPYSFFKKIRLSPAHANNGVIAAHEQVHAQQWHSADVLLIEAVMIINWFNPVVYLYRFAIKHIHEYIADQLALKSGTNKTDYALLLLNQTFNAPAHGLVNPFYNHSLLKQRIKMLQKNRSHRIGLIKYGLSVPLFISMLVLSSATISNSKTVGFVNKTAEQVFSTPAALPEIKLDNTTRVQSDVVAPTIKELPTEVIPDQSDRAKPAPVANDAAADDGNRVFTSVEQVPEFPGGLNAFSAYLAKNVRYPADMREAGVQGRVLISFVVEHDGSLSGIHVVRGVAESIDKEALRVISASPKWKPGVQNGRAVRVAYMLPITFSLISDDDVASTPTDRAQHDDGTQNITRSDTGKTISELTGERLQQNALYVVDGNVVTDISSINPAYIKSISVLKGQTATSLYGTKGRSGVILISLDKNKTLQLSPPLKATDVKH